MFSANMADSWAETESHEKALARANTTAQLSSKSLALMQNSAFFSLCLPSEMTESNESWVVVFTRARALFCIFFLVSAYESIILRRKH